MIVKITKLYVVNTKRKIPKRTLAYNLLYHIY